MSDSKAKESIVDLGLLRLEYGINGQRLRSTYKQNNQVTKVRTYLQCGIEIDDDQAAGEVLWHHYISTPDGTIADLVTQGTLGGAGDPIWSSVPISKFYQERLVFISILEPVQGLYGRLKNAKELKLLS